MKKSSITKSIDRENGKGFSNNVNIQGYVFKKKNSFIIFEIKTTHDVVVAHVKYVYFDNVDDLLTLLAHSCEFWMGNSVQFVFLREKEKTSSVKTILEELGFTIEEATGYEWKWKFRCNVHKLEKCSCPVYHMYK